MGRVVDIFPGTDGLARAVSIKVHGKIFQRPVHKLVTTRRSLRDFSSGEVCSEETISHVSFPVYSLVCVFPVITLYFAKCAPPL